MNSQPNQNPNTMNDQQEGLPYLFLFEAWLCRNVRNEEKILSLTSPTDKSSLHDGVSVARPRATSISPFPLSTMKILLFNPVILISLSIQLSHRQANEHRSTTALDLHFLICPLWSTTTTMLLPERLLLYALHPGTIATQLRGSKLGNRYPLSPRIRAVFRTLLRALATQTQNYGNSKPLYDSHLTLSFALLKHINLFFHTLPFTVFCIGEN